MQTALVTTDYEEERGKPMPSKVWKPSPSVMPSRRVGRQSNSTGRSSSIAIVRFSNDATEVLAPTSAAARDVIETALFKLQPGGSTAPLTIQGSTLENRGTATWTQGVIGVYDDGPFFAEGDLEEIDDLLFGD